MRREASNSHLARTLPPASQCARGKGSLNPPIFPCSTYSCRYIHSGGRRRRYVNKIRGLKGARVYGYTYSSQDIGVSPRKIPYSTFSHPPAASRHRNTSEDTWKIAPEVSELLLFIGPYDCSRARRRAVRGFNAVSVRSKNHAKQYISCAATGNSSKSRVRSFRLDIPKFRDPCRSPRFDY